MNHDNHRALAQIAANVHDLEEDNARLQADVVALKTKAHQLQAERDTAEATLARVRKDLVATSNNWADAGERVKELRLANDKLRRIIASNPEAKTGDADVVAAFVRIHVLEQRNKSMSETFAGIKLAIDDAMDRMNRNS